MNYNNNILGIYYPYTNIPYACVGLYKITLYSKLQLTHLPPKKIPMCATGCDRRKTRRCTVASEFVSCHVLCVLVAGLTLSKS